VVNKHIEVIPNFVDPGKFTPRATGIRKCFAEPNEKVLMHISNFRPVKRIPDIINVFEAFRSVSNPDWFSSARARKKNMHVAGRREEAHGHRPLSRAAG
jgi:glycosyltransferase involved in cell wall biosynthesis